MHIKQKKPNQTDNLSFREKWSRLFGGLIQGLFVGGLLVAIVVLLYLSHKDGSHIRQLEAQISQLRENEKRAIVDRRVSQQMEEIASGQQALSEERSREAIRQSEIAQEMTIRSETERKKAIEAQDSAEMSARRAMAAFQMAEQQRVEADNQRQQAEQAKMTADTLNYISLGRTLGSQSYAIYQTGDREVGNMLAYASYLFTDNYGGDLYTPSVFQAVTQSAGTRNSWNVHNGAVSHVCIMPHDGKVLSVSTYGEILVHQKQNGQLKTDMLLSDKRYSFRDIYAAKNGKIYAISSTGHLVIINHSQTRILTLENLDKPFSLQSMHDDQQILIIGQTSLTQIDTSTDRTAGIRKLPFRVINSSRRDLKPLLFDNQGGMYLVNDLNDLKREQVPVAGQVICHASSKNAHLSAYGMADGTIWLEEPDGKLRKLVGHLSQVTRLKFNGPRLYSSSYDGKLLFWTTNDPQLKPVNLLQTTSWLTDFTFSADKQTIWTGEHNGTVTECLISLPKIAERLRQNVKRNFSQEEWNYYVGKGIPYRKLIIED